MLNILSSVKVFIDKDDLYNYRGAGVKQTIATTIKCINTNGRLLHLLIIWPALTYRSN